MIAYIEGVTLSTTEQHAVIKTNGIGYKIAIPQTTLSSLAVGEKIELFTYMAVRENSQNLYGFTTSTELYFFELLITVSGIGPKTALNILNLATVDTLSKAILSEKPSHLVTVSGVGKKVAEKIVLELKGKVGSFGELGSSELGDSSDALEALSALGYSRKEAREILQTIPDEITDTAEKVKYALKTLG